MFGKVGVFLMSMETRSKYTSDFVPVKDITNGMIILDTNEKESKCKSLDKSIDTRERKIKVLVEEIHQLKEKINKLKEYFIYEPELHNNLYNDSKELIKIDNIEEIILTIQKLLYHYEDEGLVYNYDVISSFFKALKVDQLVLLSGPSGTGKSSLVNQLGKIINKFKVHHIAVQSSWSDVQDLLGFFNPVQKRLGQLYGRRN